MNLVLRRALGKRWRGTRLLVMIGVFAVTYVGMILSLLLGFSDDHRHSGFDSDTRSLHRKLLESASDTTQSTAPETTTRKSQFPPDSFSERELKHGAVVLYVIGMIYMFVALAIVCDEFFVPCLEVIIIKLGVSEDVAGATFMAAGGSAPELFTSFIGVFAAFTDVGIGTIVGSAVFNILFVIGMCAMFSSGVLALTWWPLFRDVLWYSISLIVLILFFRDDKIFWWEALILLCIYIAYVIFMKFNQTVERFIKSKFQRNRVTQVKSSDNLIASAEEVPDKNGVSPAMKGNSNKFRHGVLQLMIHTIDPLGEAKVHEKALKLHAIASLKVMINSANVENHNSTQEQNQNHSEQKNGAAISVISNGHVLEDDRNRNLSQETTHTTVGSLADPDTVTARNVVVSNSNLNEIEQTEGDTGNQDNAEAASTNQNGGWDEESEPLDISWPDTCRKRITYILVVPLLFPLWLTLADVRKPSARKFYIWTFIGCIIWIAIFSYMMNWWASVVGRTMGIDDAVMGLTFLAAGTSIPDMITSVIVARKGFGDMAVSSSVGSNIFDVTVGLPLPWLFHGLIKGIHYDVISSGLFCSIILLFAMLILVILVIAAFRWQMNKAMGMAMFAGYVVFITDMMIFVAMEISVLVYFFHLYNDLRCQYSRVL